MQTLLPNKIENLFFEVLGSLSDKEKRVIERRIWVNGLKETLQRFNDNYFMMNI